MASPQGPITSQPPGPGAFTPVPSRPPMANSQSWSAPIANPLEPYGSQQNVRDNPPKDQNVPAEPKGPSEGPSELPSQQNLQSVPNLPPNEPATAAGQSNLQSIPNLPPNKPAAPTTGSSAPLTEQNLQSVPNFPPNGLAAPPMGSSAPLTEQNLQSVPNLLHAQQNSPLNKHNLSSMSNLPSSGPPSYVKQTNFPPPGLSAPPMQQNLLSGRPLFLQSSTAQQSSSPMGFFTPPTQQNLPSLPNLQHSGQPTPSNQQNVPLMGQFLPPAKHNLPSMANLPPRGHPPSLTGSGAPTIQQNIPSMPNYFSSGQHPSTVNQTNFPSTGPSASPTQQNLPSGRPPFPPTQQNLPPMESFAQPTRQNLPPMRPPFPPTQQNLPPMESSAPPTRPNFPPMRPPFPSSQQNLRPMESPAPLTRQNFPPMGPPGAPTQQNLQSMPNLPPMRPPGGPIQQNSQSMPNYGPPQPGLLNGPPMPRQFPPQTNQFPAPPNMQTQSMNQGPPSGYPNFNQAPKPMFGAYPSQLGGSPDSLQIPNFIQVIEDNQKYRSEEFYTNQKGLVPPLVTTKFTVVDQGNASPRFVRSTFYTLPCLESDIKQSAIPLGLIISPFAQVQEREYEPPIIDMGPIGPVRCQRCKAYMSPFMQFVDAGRRFHCLLCKTNSDVPQEYFQYLDHTGFRMDRFERPELSLGSYEFVATKEYCKNETLPNAPAIIFIIDVSYNTVKSGLIKLLCSRMKDILKNLPIDAGQTKTAMKVGFITYSNSIHFYNVKANLTQPQMYVVGDVADVFTPLVEGFLCDAEESESVIDGLMTQIPEMFAETRETETILAPAIQAGLEALKACERVGKLMVFHSSLPTAEAPGKLKNRDDRKVLGTEKEKTVLTPQTDFYNTLGQDCVVAGCSVDLFIFNNSYVDVATIGQICRVTGGEMYKYTYFQAEIDGDRLITDVMTNVGRPMVFDAVMRIRTSTGIRPTDFYGRFYMSNTTNVELASLDCGKAIAVEIKYDTKLEHDEGAYIQVALVYTSCGGVRRIRILNLSLKTSSQLAEVYNSCDLDATVNFLMKQSISNMVETSPKAVREHLTTRCMKILTTYKRIDPSGQGLPPECMKLLPLYINALLKSEALAGGAGITIDDKSYVMMAAQTMPTNESVFFIYPRLMALHDVDPESTEMPPLMRCSINKFEDHGAYLLENGIHMFLWLGLNLDNKWVQSVFCVPSVHEVNMDKTSIPVLDNSLNSRIRDVISRVLKDRRNSMRLTITRQRDRLEMVMRQFLIEDNGVDGSLSYVDFLNQVHREIQQIPR